MLVVYRGLVKGAALAIEIRGNYFQLRGYYYNGYLPES